MLIDQLGLLTKSGDITIKRLLHETDTRLKERTGEFADVFDFVARMRDIMNLNGFAANANQLFDELIALNLKTPEDILKSIKANDNQHIIEIATAECLRLKNYLAALQPDLLEDGSSDVLLVGVLKSSVNAVLDNHPMGRGMGRPSRLTQIANAYRKMLNQPAA